MLNAINPPVIKLGFRPRLRKRHIYTWAPSTWLTNSTAQGSEMQCVPCPDDFFAVRMLWLSITSQPWQASLVKVCPSTTFGAMDGGSGHVNYFTPAGGAAWTTLTNGNQGQDIDKLTTQTSGLPTTFYVPPNIVDPTSGEATIPALSASDWMPVTSLAADAATGMRVLMARTLYPLGGVTGTNMNGGGMCCLASNGYGTQWSGLSSVNKGYDCAVLGVKTVDKVTTISDPGSWSTASVNSLATGPFSLLQFRTRNRVMQGMTVGTSMLEGTSTGTQMSNCVAYASVAQGQALLNQRPYGWFNCARGGATGQIMFERAKSCMPYIKPTYCLIQSHNDNEVATDGTATLLAQQQQFARLLGFLDFCEDQGVLPIICTPIPTSASVIGTVGSSLQWQGWNWMYNAVMALRDQGHIVLDVSTPFTTYSGATMTGTWGGAGTTWSTDGQHPNDVWQQYVAQNFLIPLFNQLDSLQ